jgi:predicted porin
MNILKTAFVTGVAALGLMGAANDVYAQSSVQLYGVVGVTLGSFKRSGGGLAAYQEGGGGLTTSFWGMRGSEDLGGGYKAIFSLESFFQPQTGAMGRSTADPFFSRNAWVGLSTPYGRFTMGRQTNPTYLNMQLLNPFVSSVVFSPIVVQSFVATYGSAILGDTVWNNTVEYTSPTLYGFTGTAIYGAGGIAGAAGVGNIGLHGTYINGPLTVAFSAQRVRQLPTAAITPEQYSYLGGATYDFNIIKLYGAAEATNEHGINVGTHTYEGGLSIPVTKSGAILAEYARTQRSGAPAAGPRIWHATASVAYDFILSKRTDIYAVYMYDKLSNSYTANEAALGIRHAF